MVLRKSGPHTSSSLRRSKSVPLPAGLFRPGGEPDTLFQESLGGATTVADLGKRCDRSQNRLKMSGGQHRAGGPVSSAQETFLNE